MANNKSQGKKLVYESQSSLYKRAVSTMNSDALIVKYSFKAETYLNAADMFKSVGDYKDAPALEQKCRLLAEEAMEQENAYQYTRACELREEATNAKGYEKAMKQFDLVKGYKDADEQRSECEKIYNRFIKRSSVKSGVIAGVLIAIVIAIVIFFNSSAWDNIWTYITTGTTVKSAASSSDDPLSIYDDLTEGDIVAFGSYNWFVLSVNEDSVRLLINHAEKHEEFRNRPFNEEQTDISWEDSSLREWLNTDFIEEGFSEEEAALILDSDTPEQVNPEYGTSFPATEDKVTLLTLEDLSEHEDIVYRIKMNTWLMIPGNADDTCVFMSARNTIMYYGYPVSTTDFYTCPVITVSTAASVQ